MRSQCALGQFELTGLVIEIEHADVAFAVDAQGSATKLQFGSGARAGGQLVAIGQWAVDVGGAPLGAACGHQAQVAGCVRHAGYAGWRIAGVVLGVIRLGLRETGTEQQQEGEYPSSVARR